MTRPPPVRLLPEHVARKIAAGEVIDRPAAIVRELLDNALDSGAKTITCEIEEGGIKKVRVSDDGFGMSREDLEQCAKPHATSKIMDDADLLNISTLGFRGEALSSIAAVSKLTITTSHENQGFIMTESLGQEKEIHETVCIQGTITQSEELFANIPARRNFLKRPASEAKMCKDIFAEKSVPHTGVSMRFVENGKLKLALSAEETLAERFINSFELPYDSRLFFEQNFTSAATVPDGKARFSFTVLLGEPSIFRTDRKFIHIYTNRRRINEYSFLQAIEYGSEGFFPNGTHPVAALILQVHPSLIDFNIHPAKREARFKDSGEIHHALSMAVKQFFHEYARKSSFSSYFSPSAYTPDLQTAHNSFAKSHNTSQSMQSQWVPKSGQTFFRDSFTQNTAQNITQTEQDTTQDVMRNSFIYLGCVFDLYLLAQKGDALYIIDQHAAHERILFDAFLAHKSETQELLVPYLLTASGDDEDAYIERLRAHLSEAGFRIEKSGKTWEISSVPALWSGTEDDLRKDLLESRIAPNDLLKELVAGMSCRKAIKDGNIISRERATEIIEKVFALSNPRCPHGRPIYYALTKDALAALVRRT